MIGLTQRQADALRFIAGFQQAKGYCPSFEEIRVGIGVASKANVARLVSGLMERGKLRVLRGKQRAMEPTRPVTVPRAPDGAPLYFVAIGERG